MYDVLILSVNQKEPSAFQSGDITVVALNKKGECKSKYYYEIWPFINNSDGILYKVFTNGDFFEYECGDDLFEFDYSKNNENCVPIIYSGLCNEIAEDLTGLSIKEVNQNSFIDLLHQMICVSPIKTILFLCCGQSHDKEIILGTVTLKHFSQMLAEGSVCTNICYIISN